MRVGIVILPDTTWELAARRWRLAEEYGFHHAWTYDHLGWRDLVDGPWFDAIATLTAAAMSTSRIRLGTLVASPNFRHPVHLAREATTLDDLSNGRLVLGVGAGGAGFDATVLGAAPLSQRARVDRFAEFVELLDLLLRNDRVTWRGEYYAAVDARSTPGCRQSPRAELVVAANGPRSMRLAARYGDGWVTTGPTTDDLEEWWRLAARSARQYTETLAAARRPPATESPAAEPAGGEGRSARYLLLGNLPVLALSSVSFFTEVIERAAECGFTDVIAPWPRSEGWYAGDEAVLEAIAAEVLPAHRACL